MEKVRNPSKNEVFLSTDTVKKASRFSTVFLGRWVFHNKVFLFHREWGYFQRLELMLVVISFTLSAKAESRFICFSTLSME